MNLPDGYEMERGDAPHDYKIKGPDYEIRTERIDEEGVTEFAVIDRETKEVEVLSVPTGLVNVLFGIISRGG